MGGINPHKLKVVLLGFHGTWYTFKLMTLAGIPCKFPEASWWARGVDGGLLVAFLKLVGGWTNPFETY